MIKIEIRNKKVPAMYKTSDGQYVTTIESPVATEKMLAEKGITYEEVTGGSVYTVSIANNGTIMDCANKNLGCSLYECPNCHDIIFIGHTCKSRLCSSCGYKYKNDRVESIMQTAYNCNHRQIVFTIPESLRIYFFKDYEKMINILFKSVSETLYSILREYFKRNKKGVLKKYKSKIKYTPRFFRFSSYFW